jgi:hypothetical protein
MAHHPIRNKNPLGLNFTLAFSENMTYRDFACNTFLDPNFKSEIP